MTKKPKLSEIVESAQRIVDNLGIGGDYLGQEKDAIKDITQEIERLLADEREPIECGHPKACLAWRNVIATQGEPGEVCGQRYCSACAERERVREMCVKELAVLRDQWDALTSGELDNDGVAACRSGIELIRQLDLTKLDEELESERNQRKKGGD